MGYCRDNSGGNGKLRKVPRSYSACFSFPFRVLILLPKCCISSPARFWFLTLERSGALESQHLPQHSARMWAGSEVCSHLGWSQ